MSWRYESKAELLNSTYPLPMGAMWWNGGTLLLAFAACATVCLILITHSLGKGAAL